MHHQKGSIRKKNLPLQNMGKILQLLCHFPLTKALALGKDLYETVDVKAKVLKKAGNKQVIIKDDEKAKL